MTRPSIVVAALVTALLGAVASAPLHAQAQTPARPVVADARWSPWLGCWRSVDDLVGLGARVCVVPAGDGVTLRTIVSGQSVSDESRVADGTARPVRDAGCTGTESTRWSADGLRAYRSAQATCGANAARALAGVAFIVPGPVWVDVQTVTSGGSTNVRVTRYARATDRRLPDGTVAPLAPAGAAAPAVSRGWTTDEVMEASRYLLPDGVQAAIGEGPTAFRLNAKSLAQMADGGVAEPVIDLMVALTYPEKFVIDSAASRSAGMGGGMGIMMAGGAVDPFFSPIMGPGALYGCYSPYGWASDGYWANCAGYGQSIYASYPGYYSGRNGFFDPYYYNSYGGWVSTQVPQGAIGEAQAPGRLVNGHGYTQVRPVEATSPGAFTTANRSDSNSGGSTSGPSNGGSTSSGATSSGYSGGSSGGSGGGDRTAVARPPGGGQ